MTMPRATTRQLIDVATKLGCVGVELRNDLGKPLFDGLEPTEIKSSAAAKGQRILGLAELKAFNQDTANKRDEAEALIATAQRSAAEGVALIPAITEEIVARADQKDALRKALQTLQPILENYGVMGLIEPLGFATSSLRLKEDVVAVLDDLGCPACFAMIHDTFHHHLAGEMTLFADLTAIVHISGVTNPEQTVATMTDADRVLVSENDRLNNIGQLRGLRAAGYTGPASFEAFAPEIHDMTDPTEALAGSIAFINAALANVTAGAA